MTPASAGILDNKTVTATITGPVSLALKLEGRNISILHGELISLTMGLILTDPSSHSILYTDHLNSVCLIDDSKTIVDQKPRLQHMNSHSYYRWILTLAASSNLDILYTPGHSDEVSTPARMNFEADHYASSAQRHTLRTLTAPIPTFFMDDFTFYNSRDGWIESNIRTYTDKLACALSSHAITNGHQQHMALHLYDTKAPPEYSYTHTYSAYSALVQLYARSGQLPSADLLHAHGKLTSPQYRVGYNTIEDTHHIFVHCTRYTEWRAKATTELLRRTVSKLTEKGIEEADAVDLLNTVKLLFSDDNIWPLQYSTYYLGHIPRFDHLVPTTNDPTPLSQSRLAHHFAAGWHVASIRLAGRIWGDWQKTTAVAIDARGRRRS
jgi:hypothetical protein